jgi:hypothetical protein
MHLEIIRELSEALASTALGVNFQLDTLPRDSGHTVPVDVLVVDSITDEDLIKGAQIDRGKEILLLVAPDGPLTTAENDTKSEYALGVMPVGITVVHRGVRTIAQKVQDVSYVLRAIALSMKAYFAQRQTDRTRNDVVVLRTFKFEAGLIEDDGMGALGAVVFVVQALDLRAQRTV